MIQLLQKWNKSAIIAMQRIFKLENFRYMKIGDRVIAISERATYARDMYYRGIFAGYTKTGKARVKGLHGIRCYNLNNVNIDDQMLFTKKIYTVFINNSLPQIIDSCKVIKDIIKPKKAIDITNLSDPISRDFFRRRKRVNNIFYVKDNIIYFE